MAQTTHHTLFESIVVAAALHVVYFVSNILYVVISINKTRKKKKLISGIWAQKYRSDTWLTNWMKWYSICWNIFKLLCFSHLQSHLHNHALAHILAACYTRSPTLGSLQAVWCDKHVFFLCIRLWNLMNTSRTCNRKNWNCDIGKHLFKMLI